MKREDQHTIDPERPGPFIGILVIPPEFLQSVWAEKNQHGITNKQVGKQSFGIPYFVRGGFPHTRTRVGETHPSVCYPNGLPMGHTTGYLLLCFGCTQE